MGDWAGNNSWSKDCEAAYFTAEDGKLSITAVADGNIRSFVKSALITSGVNDKNEPYYDWWHAEFVPGENNTIAFREGGDNPADVAITAGQVLTYDFNAGTATIEDGEVFVPAITIDGDFAEWDEIASAEPADAFKAFKITNDAKNFYFYIETDPGTRLWSGGAYLYLYFDLDNDLTTGAYSGSTGMGANNYEAYAFMYLFKGTAEAPEIATNDGGGTAEGLTFDNVVIAGNNPATASDIVKMEIVIPRANFTTQVKAGDVIGVGSYRSKDGGNIHYAGYTVL